MVRQRPGNESTNFSLAKDKNMVYLPEGLKKYLRLVRRWAHLLVGGGAEERARREELQRNKEGSRHVCYICKNTFDHFYPYRGGSADIPTCVLDFDIIGSDVDNFSCPHCRSHDRERHLFMYFDRLKLWDAIPGGAVLHVAPEGHLRDAIVRLAPREYVHGDLFSARGDMQKIDVTAIAYPDEYFDLAICNHVLEHVPNDRQAMMELYRVLKKGRHAVLQTPFSALLPGSFEDSNINTDEMRRRFYGQEDHVRIYGQDLFTRLGGVGFEVMPQRHQVVLGDLGSQLYGVNMREDLILVKKRE